MVRTAFTWLFFAVVLLPGSPPAWCSSPAVFHKGYHTYQGITIPFHVYVPTTLEPGKEYPAVLCLHGFTERGDDSSAVANNYLTTAWVSDATQAQWPCFVIVPQCPMTGLWTGDVLLAANDVVDSLFGVYPIDRSRLYVTGLSMGGYGTWELITRFPSRFAAAIPLAGGGDTSKAALIRDVPLWNFHGAIDFVVNPTASRSMVAALERSGVSFVYTNCFQGDCTGLPDSAVSAMIAAGATHLYTEYQFGGHDIWPQAYTTPFLMSWVFSQRSGTNAVRAEPPVRPGRPVLLQNYPNPFNPNTKIEFSHQNSEFVTLKVYDVLGREVATLVNEEMDPGDHSVTWNARAMPAGLYLCRMSAGGHVMSRKLLLIR